MINIRNKILSKCNSQPGFTLIELLLVIIILGVMATFGLNYYQQKNQRFKIEKAALQIQTIAQAAVSFYSANGQWPASCDDITFANFLPVGSNQDPWGKNYTCQTAPGGKKFQIITGDLPSTAIRTQLISLLPNAAPWNNSVAQMVSEIAIPAHVSASQANGELIQYINWAYGITDGSSYSFSFACPRGWTGNAVAFPTALYINPFFANFPLACYGYGLGSLPITLLNSTASCTPAPSSPNASTFVCNLNFQAYSTQVGGTLTPFFCKWNYHVALGRETYGIMGYCSPPSSTNNSSPSIPTTF